MSESRSLLELRVATYELLVSMEAVAQLASSGPNQVFYDSWPALAQAAPSRLTHARAKVKTATATTTEEIAALAAMRNAIEELAAAYAKLGPRAKAAGFALARLVARLKARSGSW